jgi:hypothetical protein
MRERFEKAVDKERDAGETSKSQMKSTVMDRVDNQVRRLEQENLSLQDAQVRQQLKMQNDKKREIGNVRDAYQKNMDNYQEQRDEAVRMNNEGNRKDVLKVSKQASKQMVDTNRFYRGQLEEQNRISRDAYENLSADFATRNEGTKAIADQRVKHIVETTEQEKGRMIENQAENHMAMQRVKQDEMRELRDALTADKAVAVNKLQAQLQNQEVKHAQRLDQTIQKYEKEILSLKDQMMRDKRLADESLRRTTEELTRQHQINLDQLEAKNRDRLRTVNIQHGEEVRSVNKRHEQRLDQVIGEIKKT